MTRKLITSLTAALLVSTVAATAGFAQENAIPPQSPPAGHHMGDHGGMMGMMGQMSPDHMKQMTAMVETCNRMMNAQTRPGTEHGPDQGG